MASAVTPARSRASVRVRAALAGGLVFGIAAGLTVASWTDAEYVGSTFTASNFNVETSLNASAYSTTSPLTISVAGVYPGATGGVYVQALARTATPSIAGTVRLSHATIASPTGLTSVLRYRVVQTTAACAAGAFTGSATYVVGTSTFATGTVPVSTALAASTPLAVTANSGTTVGYCFEFSLPATGVLQSTYQGTSSAPMTWTVTGSS